MIVATPAPKVRHSQWLVVVYAYAVSLMILSVAALMGLGGFDFAGIAYETPGEPAFVVFIAALQIFSLPFLLRLPLSKLARFFSATFSLLNPIFLVANVAYLMFAGVFTPHYLTLAGGALLVAIGAVSFVVLDGRKAVRLGKQQ
jgi:hypothetical protein